MHISCVYMCADPQRSRLLLQFFSTPLEGNLVRDMRNKAQSVRSAVYRAHRLIPRNRPGEENTSSSSRRINRYYTLFSRNLWFLN